MPLPRCKGFVATFANDGSALARASAAEAQRQYLEHP